VRFIALWGLSAKAESTTCKGGQPAANIAMHQDAAEFDRIGYARPIDTKKRWTEGSSCAARIPRLCLCVYAVLAVSLFLCCAWSKLSFLFDSLFDGDGLMNLHESYIVRPNVLLRAMALPFSTFNRPTGALYYRLCFEIFGWNPAATEVGAAAALLYSFHLYR
jgi:hypothetical protein